MSDTIPDKKIRTNDEEEDSIEKFIEDQVDVIMDNPDLIASDDPAVEKRFLRLVDKEIAEESKKPQD